MILISSLSIFPIKSCRGIAVRRARVVRRGLEHDHRWMVIDETGYMITQREAPKLATVITVIRRDALIVEAEGRLCVRVPLRPKDDGTRVNVYVHDEERRKPIAAMDMGETAALWFSQHLGRPARLVLFPNDTRRFTKRDPTVECAFHDGYPLLVISEESLDELNRRLTERGKPELPMNRFRPPIVVRGCASPNEEDRWLAFEAGGVRMCGVKLCARCRVTQTDQRLGIVTGGEPIRTFATYRVRLDGDKTVHIFGLDTTHQTGGILRVGDRVTVVTEGDIFP